MALARKPSDQEIDLEIKTKNPGTCPFGYPGDARGDFVLKAQRIPLSPAPSKWRTTPNPFCSAARRWLQSRIPGFERGSLRVPARHSTTRLTARHGNRLTKDGKADANSAIASAASRYRPNCRLHHRLRVRASKMGALPRYLQQARTLVQFAGRGGLCMSEPPLTAIHVRMVEEMQIA